MRLDFLLQLLAGAEEQNRHLGLGNAQHLGDLLVLVALEVAKREHFGGTGTEGRQRSPETIAEFRPGLRLRTGQGRGIVERDTQGVLAAPHHVDGHVDSCPAKIAFLIVEGLGRVAAPDQPDKDLLENIFGVGGIASDPVGRTEDQGLSLLEDPLDGIGGRGSCSFSNREFQGAPPALSP